MKYLILVWCFMVACFVQAETLNLLNFGARGDCQRVTVNTTAGSFKVTITNGVTAFDVGKTMEIYGCGATNIGLNTSNIVAGNIGSQYITTNNQDYICIIQSTNGDGSNVTVSADIVFNWANTNAPATKTIAPQLTGSFLCDYGTNNAYPFQAAVASGSTNFVLYIPHGNPSAFGDGTTNAYFFMNFQSYSNWNAFNNSGSTAYTSALTNSGIILQRAGFTVVGDGRGQTILKGQGAWKAQGQFADNLGTQGQQYGRGTRGSLICVFDPITDDYPLIFTNLTLDAGVPIGLADNYNTLQPANYVDGLGWDEGQHCYVRVNGEPGPSYIRFDNVEWCHCRGEMDIDATGTAWNEYFVCTNFDMWDGEASGFNTEVAYNIQNGTISNILFACEMYMKYVTNRPSLMAGLIETNILHSFGTFDGGTVSNLPTVVSNLTCLASGLPNGLYDGAIDGFQVIPLSNLSILNSVLTGSNVVNWINVDTAGFFGSDITSNLLISGDHFSFYTNGVIITTGSGLNLTVSNCTLDVLSYKSGAQTIILNEFGACTNITLADNDFTALNPQISAGVNITPVNNTASALYGLVLTNTTYQCNYNPTLFSWGHNNIISYRTGPWYQLNNILYSDQTITLSTVDATNIPNGAEIALDTTVNSGFTTATVYFASNTNTSGSFFVSGPGVYGFYYNASKVLWQTTPPTIAVPPIGSPGSAGAGF